MEARIMNLVVTKTASAALQRAECRFKLLKYIVSLPQIVLFLSPTEKRHFAKKMYYGVHWHLTRKKRRGLYMMVHYIEATVDVLGVVAVIVMLANHGRIIKSKTSIGLYRRKLVCYKVISFLASLIHKYPHIKRLILLNFINA